MKWSELGPGDVLRHHQQRLPPKPWIDLMTGNAGVLAFDHDRLCIGPHGLYVHAAGGGL